MLRFFAFLVVAFFVTLYASGNNIQSIKATVNHWAGASGQMTGTDSGDWGTS